MAAHNVRVLHRRLRARRGAHDARGQGQGQGQGAPLACFPSRQKKSRSSNVPRNLSAGVQSSFQRLAGV